MFQSFNLIPVLTALDNVELPLNLTRLSRSECLEHATNALNLAGLADRLHHVPRQLSGGGQQRAAVVRSHRPRPGVRPGGAHAAARTRYLDKGRLLGEGEIPEDWRIQPPPA